MKRFSLGCFLLFSGIVSAYAAPPEDLSSKVSLRSSYESIADPLTTEQIWILDPKEANPHRQRWALSRRLEVADLNSLNQKDGRYGISTGSILATSRSYLRGAGPWYRPFSDFGCEKEPVSWFATEEGTRVAIKKGKEIWEDILNRSRIRLALNLRKVSEGSTTRAKRAGEQIFNQWVEERDTEWRTTGHAEARKSEWEFYLQKATELGLCNGKKSGIAPPWESLMEAPLPILSKDETPRFITRAPARRWGGSYSVRLSVTVGSRILNGQFLIDSSAKKSLIHAGWLEAQGVAPDWVIIEGQPARRVVWSKGAGVGKLIAVDRVEMSGHEIGTRQFILAETLLYEPPETVAACCDGILGQDFLSQNVVEFRPGPPVEIILWPRDGFARNLHWIEIATPTGGMDGAPLSACTVQPARSEIPLNKGSERLFGARWDTGSESSIDIHEPWRQSTFVKNAALWDVVCRGEKIARSVPDSGPDFGTDSGSPHSERTPAVTIGMATLGRGPFIMDQPHGRLWFSKEGTDAAIPENRSGLRFKYVLVGGDRELRVSGLRKGIGSDLLMKSGLKLGSAILRVDDKEAAEMDEWEIGQRLSGVYGNHVSLVWKAKGGAKTIVIPVRDDF